MKKLFMTEAIQLAEQAVRRGDGGPFGALVVCRGEVVGRGWNRVVSECDPTAHAEILAIREAARRLGRFHLDGCTLYTSSEPCPMCFSAAYWAHIESVIYAASARDAADLGFDDHFIYRELKRSAAKRKMASEQLMRDQALAVFRLWRESEQRLDY